ncbi:MAG: metallophosphoesterase family protein [Pseudomonadota bacterium]
MRVQDLGVLEGPVLLFGGPYSNLQATKALFDEARGQGVPHVICTGDVVAYCANPAETVGLIRESGCAVVAGNCEQQLAAGRGTCGCGFEAGSTCDLLSAGWYAYADTHVGAEDRHWMGTLPDMAVFTQGGRRFAVIHGGARDVSRFIWPNTSEQVFLTEIGFIESQVGRIDGVIAGHCGLAFIRGVAGRLWTNPGVIGMPANHGKAVGQYAIMEDGIATLHDLHFDRRAAHVAMVEAGLTQGYHDTLLTGYWPSEDVLPPEFRRGALANG